jgi:hypothetical protein
MKIALGKRLTPLLVILAAMQLRAAPAYAQDGGIPPWPIIYDGQVYLDGKLIHEGMLTAHVGDWMSTEVPIAGGVFHCADPCLIVGPPDFSYLGQSVTFHLKGIAEPASYTFAFPAMESPLRDSVDLFFGDVPATRPVSFWIALTAGGLIGLAGVSFGLYRLLLRSLASRP